MRAFLAFFVSMLVGSSLIAQLVSAATTESLNGAPPPSRPAETPAPEQIPMRTLGDFLTTPTIQTSYIPGFYAEIPPHLDNAVRRIAEDNYEKASELLLSELDKATDPRERARILMWLGIGRGQQAIDFPTTGWTSGTSATQYLKEAIKLDKEVYYAPDAARVLAEMVANGWADEDPIEALPKYEAAAERSRDAVDFYFAGMISRRLSAKAWAYSDTTEQDKRTLNSLAKAVARDPARYETWIYYLRGLMPVGLHDLATTESYKMYDYFKELRTPVLADQGPAFLLLTTASYRTMQQDNDMLDQLQRDYPERPFSYFEKAMRAIETTASDALILFPDFIHRVENGTLKLEPREQGYYPSAYYKLAYLKQQFGDLPGSLHDYLKVKQMSPGYAEVNSNLAILKAQMAEEETTGPQKLKLLQEAIQHAADQEKYDFRGKVAVRAQELRMKLRQLAREVERDLADGKVAPTTATVTRSPFTTTTPATIGEVQP